MENSVGSSSSGSHQDSSGEETSIGESVVSSTTSSTKHTSVTSYLPPCRLCGAVASGFHYASKKGRYTHERRTQYTMEIKREELQKVKKEASMPSEPTHTELIYFQEILDKINLHSKENFTQLNSFMQNQSELTAKIDKLVAEHCPNTIPDYPLYFPGSGQVQQFGGLCQDFRDAAAQLELANSLSASPPVQSLNVLWRNWMAIAELLFVQLTRFAKQLPGFNDLLVDDKIILLKSARIEVSTIMAHPACRPDKSLIGLCSMDTGEIFLTPLLMFPQKGFAEHFNAQHNTCMARLKKNEYTLEDINVIIAFIVLSPDREGLAEPGKVENLQNNILQILEYTLKKNHPSSPRKLAETLLVLPELRQISEEMRQLLYDGKKETNPELSPLINEVL
ncbi:peroxisome proliferator-activated receptor alpha-like isoform X2 [Watersipora subatra]|uniref:peroxisome proliferator-activated receptor alpha-like isoform X2 n=1 Tax=Watersipora subatra TaxID=2589382 RepID=UPI00355BE458